MHVSLNYYSGFVSQLKSFHCRLNETVMKLYSVYNFSLSMQKKKTIILISKYSYNVKVELSFITTKGS